MIFEINKDTVGIHENVTSKQYHSIKRVVGPTGITHIPASKSMLVKFMEDPDTWKRGKVFKKTKSMDMGSLLDAMCTEPDLFKTDFVIRPDKWKDWRTNEAKEWRAAQEKMGKTCVDDKMLREATAAKDQIMSHPWTKAAIEQSRTQIALVGQYKSIFTKSLVDLLPDENGIYRDALIDMKRTVGFSPRQFKYECFNYKYHWQAAFYLDQYNKLTGENRTRFYFLISNSLPPFGAGIIEMGANMIEKGRKEYKYALDYYNDCVEKNQFPSVYGDGPILIDIENEDQQGKE